MELRILYRCTVCALLFEYNYRWRFGVPAVCPDCPVPVGVQQVMPPR